MAGKIYPDPYVFSHTTHTWAAFKISTAAVPEKKYGWYQKDGDWRFYNGITGQPVWNDLLQGQEGKWIWIW